MKKRAWVVAVALFLAACGDDPSGPRAANILTSTDPLVVRQGETAEVSATVVDAAGTTLPGITLTFTSKAPALFTVSSSGLVTSAGPAGSGELEIRGGGLTRAILVRVDPVADRLTASPSPLAVPQRGTAQLQAQVLDRAGQPISGASVTYTSAAPALMTVSSGGLVTSVGPAGQTTIAVTSGSLSVNVVAVVAQTPASIRITPDPIRLARRQSLQLVADVLDVVGTVIPGSSPTLASSDPTLVTVSSSGVITSVGGAGATTVIATIGSISRTVGVTVIGVTSPTGNDTSSVGTLGASYGVAVNPSGLVLVGHLDGRVSRFVLGAPGNATPLQIAPGGQVLAVAFDSSGQFAYASRGQPQMQVDVINLGTNSVVDSIDVGTVPLDVLVSNDKQHLFIGSIFGVLFRFDVATRDPRGGILMHASSGHGQGPGLNLLVNRAGTRLWSTFSSYSLAEADLQAMTETRQLAAPPNDGVCQGMALTSDEKKLYAVCETDNIVEWDAVTGQWQRRIANPGCGGGFGLALSPDDRVLIVGCYNFGGVRMYDRATGALIKSFDIREPRRIAMSADGSVAVVTTGESRVFIIR